MTKQHAVSAKGLGEKMSEEDRQENLIMMQKGWVVPALMCLSQPVLEEQVAALSVPFSNMVPTGMSFGDGCSQTSSRPSWFLQR